MDEIVLDSSRKWATWYSKLRGLAIIKSFLDFVNPDSSNPPAIPQPTDAPQVSSIDPNAAWIGDLDEGQPRLYDLKLRIWRGTQDDVFRIQRALHGIAKYIHATVPLEHSHFISKDHISDRVRALTSYS